MQPPKYAIFAAVIHKSPAEIAQLVEHDLAKVGVASSSLVFRSRYSETFFAQVAEW